VHTLEIGAKETERVREQDISRNDVKGLCFIMYHPVDLLIISALWICLDDDDERLQLHHPQLTAVPTCTTLGYQTKRKSLCMPDLSDTSIQAPGQIDPT